MFHQKTGLLVAILLCLIPIVGCTSPEPPTPLPTPEPVVIVVTATPEPPTPTTTPSPVPTRTRAADDGSFPVASYTPTPSPTATATPTPTATNTPPFTATPTATPTPRHIPANIDWTPVERDFDGMMMVQVPPGCFEMGENGEGGRQCFDEPFWIGKYEVTNAQYAEFIDAGGYDNPDYWTDAGWQERQLLGWTQPRYWSDFRFSNPSQPVASVSWYEAMAYAAWRDMTLCTEAQWEYAARGPDGLIYPWGNAFVADNLVYQENSGGRTAVVGSRPTGVSWVGAVDMAGNVWNWTQSESRDYPYNPDDGRENIVAATRRITRGGAWNTSLHDARAIVRYIISPASRGSGLGLRVCMPSS